MLRFVLSRYKGFIIYGNTHNLQMTGDASKANVLEKLLKSCQGIHCPYLTKLD